jgi:methionine-rich copper-binding protein CopC
MKKIFLACLAALSLNSANAQVNLTSNTYTQDFNALDTTTTPSGNLPTGWFIYEKGTSAAVDQLYVGSAGASGTGNVYSYGSAGSNDRALGSVTSGTNAPKYGVAFTNNTGAAITSFTINFTLEQWRVGDLNFSPTDSLDIQYSSNATALYDSNATWLPSNIICWAPNNTATANGAIDGNLTGNKAAYSGLINVSVPVGSTLWIRVTDINAAGVDDGISIDDVSINFSNVPVVKPLLVSTLPADNATNVAFGSSNLTITFDKNITLGTGNVYVNDLTASTTQTITASSCTVSGMMVTIPGVNLASASSYAVQFDSTCFTNSGYKCDGIYNNAAWNFATTNPRPLISSLLPADNSFFIPLPTSLAVTFDKNITAGTGTIYIVNITDATVATKTVPSADVVISGSTATVSNITALFSKNYAIMYDSTCFNASGNNAYGIYDSTRWNFSTSAPPPAPVTALNETFANCQAFTLVGGFTQFSQIGNSTWRCNNTGVNDTSSVRINGGNNPNDNTDWLFTPPLNLSAMTNPYFHFYAKKKFTGVTTKEVLVSNNYIGYGDPSTATWVNLNKDFSGLVDDAWAPFNNTSVVAYKASNFHIAFKYTSTVANTSDEWAIDDAVITEGSVSIKSFADDNTIMYVANNTTNTQLFVRSDANDQYSVCIFDALGKKIATQNIRIVAGAHSYAIQMPTAANGMYIMQVSNGKNIASLKFHQ